MKKYFIDGKKVSRATFFRKRERMSNRSKGPTFEKFTIWNLNDVKISIEQEMGFIDHEMTKAKTLTASIKLQDRWIQLSKCQSLIAKLISEGFNPL